MTAPRLPNFLFLGPDKSGSSWIYRELGRHPEVYLAPAKDTYFFDREYERGVGWYLSQFQGLACEAIVGEICHDYLFSSVAAMRIEDLLGPDVKLMVCLREPAERAYSDYLNQLRNGWRLPSFKVAVARVPSLIDSGRYCPALRVYLERFGRDQVHIGVFDELRADPQEFLNKVTDWLGVQRTTLMQDQREPARAAASPRSPITARGGKWLAVQMRSRGHARLLGRLKSSTAVQRMFYRRDVPRGDAPAEGIDLVRNALRQDVHDLSALTGIDFAGRWGYR